MFGFTEREKMVSVEGNGGIDSLFEGNLFVCDGGGVKAGVVGGVEADGGVGLEADSVKEGTDVGGREGVVGLIEGGVAGGLKEIDHLARGCTEGMGEFIIKGEELGEGIPGVVGWRTELGLKGGGKATVMEQRAGKAFPGTVKERGIDVMGEVKGIKVGVGGSRREGNTGVAKPAL